MRILVIFLISLFLIFPVFSEEEKPTPQPSICVRIIATDGTNHILCIDGYQYYVIVHTGGAAVVQMREIKDGKEIIKTCECKESI